MRLLSSKTQETSTTRHWLIVLTAELRESHLHLQAMRIFVASSFTLQQSGGCRLTSDSICVPNGALGMFYVFIFSAVSRGLSELSFLTRNRTRASVIGSAES